jgi:23S rRNA pseudouridine1911/1915/1917 synthase
VLVIDKPAGLLSVPAPDGGEETALGAVTAYVRHLHPRRPFVGRVHRLDRETSGALAFALSPAARAGLIELFRKHHIERHYLALVASAPRANEGLVDAPIRDAWRHGRRGVARPGEPAEPARTRWKVVERLGGASLLEVMLETGRQHQVRAHLAHVGLPILGDSVYGPASGLRGLSVTRPMLHARRLAFRHPISGQPVVAESPVPEDFAAALAWLRRRARAHDGRERGATPASPGTNRPRRSRG